MWNIIWNILVKLWEIALKILGVFTIVFILQEVNSAIDKTIEDIKNQNNPDK